MDYVLTVKRRQGIFHEELTEYFEDKELYRKSFYLVQYTLFEWLCKKVSDKKLFVICSVYVIMTCKIQNYV